MRLPSAIHLMGYTLKVEVIDEDDWQHEDAAGFYDPDKLLIAIRETRKPEVAFHVLLHEVTHAILMALNHDELSKDERFVDTFSGLLAQALGTAEYDAPIGRKPKRKE